MKQIHAPLQFGREPATQKYSRESIFDSSLQKKYDHLKQEKKPFDIPHRRKTYTTTYSKAVELPFAEFQPSFRTMELMTASDDSGDRKGIRERARFDQMKTIYYNELYNAKLRRVTSALNTEYLQWKSYSIDSGLKIRWTGEVTFYGSYILLTTAMTMTPEFFYTIFFYSGLYKSKAGRFVILQFFEKLLNIRYVKPYYDLLEQLGSVEVSELKENDIFKALTLQLQPGFASALPVMSGTLAIARSFLREKDVKLSSLILKQAPQFLASSTVNFVTATLVVQSYGTIFPVILCQIAANSVVQLLTSKIIDLSKMYFFIDAEADEKEVMEAEVRKQIEEEKQEERNVRRKYVENGVVGKDIDDRIKMKFDWEGNFGKNISVFQNDLYKSWTERGKGVPIFGSKGFDALLSIWGLSTTFAFIMFRTSDDFRDYQLSTGENINMRFTLDFLTKMLKSFRFFGNTLSVELLALPVVQKLRNDSIRIFTNLVGGMLNDMKTYVGKLKEKITYTGGPFDMIDTLQKQSLFAYYFFEAMKSFFSLVDTISDPVFRSTMENYLNLRIPVGYSLTNSMLNISIEDSLKLFESMNLYFLKFGVTSLETSDGHINFFNWIVSQSTKGRYTNPAPVFYKYEKEKPEYLKPDTFLGQLASGLAINIPEAFTGYNPKTFLLSLPTSERETNLFLDMPTEGLTVEQKNKFLGIWNEIQTFQKIPAIFTLFIKDMKKDKAFYTLFTKGIPKEKQLDTVYLGDLFEEKMRDPEIRQIFTRLQIGPTDLTHITKSNFIEFVGKYNDFLKDALEKLNTELRPAPKPDGTPSSIAFTEIKLDDVLQGTISREVMSRFADLYAEQYSSYVMKMSFSQASLFKNFKDTFAFNYSFQDGATVASHDFHVSRGLPPPNFTEYKPEKLEADILGPKFFNIKKKILKRGRKVDGKFVADEKAETMYEEEVEFPLSDKEKKKIRRSFDMLQSMGYRLFYKKGNGKTPDGKTKAKPSSPLNIIDDFEAFFTRMIKNSVSTLPDEWKTGFMRESLYLNPKSEYFSGEMNVLHNDETPNFFYNWKLHAGLGDYIYNRREDSSSAELALEQYYKRGELSPNDERAYLSLVGSKLNNKGKKEANDENLKREQMNLMYEYDNAQLRTIPDLEMSSLFNAMMLGASDSSLLRSGRFEKVKAGEEGKEEEKEQEVPVDPSMTFNTVIDQMITSIDKFGMFPDDRNAIFGGPLIGNANTFDQENTVIPNIAAGHIPPEIRGKQTVQQFWTKPTQYETLEQKKAWTRKMLANTFQGLFGNVDGPVAYRALDINGKPISAPINTKVWTSNKTLNPREYRSMLTKSTQQTPFRNLPHDESRYIFLAYLYLVTDNGIVNLERFNEVQTELLAMRTAKPNASSTDIRRDQLEYILGKIQKLFQAGKKGSNFVDDFFKRTYDTLNPVEYNMEVGSRYIFQLGYLSDSLDVMGRIKRGKGLINDELYDGTYPFLKSLDRSYKQIGSFYFDRTGYMGFNYDALSKFFGGKEGNTEEYLEFLKWKRNVQQSKINVLFNKIKLKQGETLTESDMVRLMTQFEDQPTEISLYEIAKKNLEGTYYKYIFPESLLSLFTSEDPYREVIDFLESPDTLRGLLGGEGKNLEGNHLDKLRGLINQRMRSVITEQNQQILEFEEKMIQISQSHKQVDTGIKAEEARINESIDKLYNRIYQANSTADVAPPIERGEAPGRGEPAPPPPPPPPPPSSDVALAEKPGVSQKPPAIRETATQTIATRLAEAQKVQQIQELKQQLSQTTSLAERTELQLKLLTSLINIFGGDDLFHLGGTDFDINSFLVDLAPFPEDIALKPPEPKAFEPPDLPELERCALLSGEYELQGAESIVTNQAEQMIRDRYMGCRKKAPFINISKTILNKAFSWTKSMSGAILQLACALGGGALGFATAGPLGAVKGTTAAFSACGGGYQLLTLSEPFIINATVSRYIIPGSPLLKKLADETKPQTAQEKITTYDAFFSQKLDTLEEYKYMKDNIKSLILLLYIEQYMSKDSALNTVEPVSKILFGDGKESHMNYYPYFKPSIEMVSAIKGLSQFDLTKINDPLNMLTQIRDLKISEDPGILTFLFGQKYTAPTTADQLEANPAYDIWYKIGNAIARLDKFSSEHQEIPEIKAEKGGNLYQTFGYAISQIEDMFSDKNPVVNEFKGSLEDQYALEQERQKRAEEILRIERAAKPSERKFVLDDIIPHIHKLTSHVQLDATQKAPDSPFSKSPLLMDDITFSGFITDDVNPAGPLGRVGTRVITGMENKVEWNVMSDTGKKHIRDMIRVEGANTVSTSTGFLGWYTHTINPYEKLNTLLGYTTKKTQIDTLMKNAFLPGESIPTHQRYFTGDIDMNIYIMGQDEIFTSSELKSSERHLGDVGNLPPFFFVEKTKWDATHEGKYSATLNKYYDKETIKISIPDTTKTIEVIGYVLKTDTKRFNLLQQGATSEYTPVSLLEAVLTSKQFKLKGLPDKKYSLFKENTDSENDAWFKKTLARLIFTTIPDTYSPLISIEEGERVTSATFDKDGPQYSTEPAVLFKLKTEVTLPSGKQELGKRVNIAVSEKPGQVENVNIRRQEYERLMQEEKERIEREQAETTRMRAADIDAMKSRVGLEFMLKEISKPSSDLTVKILELVLWDPMLKRDLAQPVDDTTLLTLTKGILAKRLEDYYTAHKDIHKDSIQDIPKLSSLSKENIAAAKSTLGNENFNTIQTQLETNLNTIGLAMKTAAGPANIVGPYKTIADILLLNYSEPRLPGSLPLPSPPPLPLPSPPPQKGGGDTIDYPLVYISVPAYEVIYPRDIASKYIL
jgi:hypothetical protein